jgi:predicted outer membrane repeat protein
MHCAGGVYLDIGAATIVSNCTFTGNQAWHSGGAVCTYMPGDFPEGKVPDVGIDLDTGLTVSSTYFFDNKGMFSKLMVGPHFALNLPPHPDPAQQANMPHGVVWRKRLCGNGEQYNNISGYCDPCPAFTHLLRSDPAVQKGVPRNISDEQCKPAPSNAVAPGGAVLVPHDLHWHLPGAYGEHVPQTVLNCKDCPNMMSCLDCVRR